MTRKPASTAKPTTPAKPTKLAVKPAVKTAAKPAAKPRAPTRPAAGGKASHAADSLSHDTIASDIAAFRKRGGRIEVLGNTPLRTTAPAAFRSKNTSQRKTSAG